MGEQKKLNCRQRIDLADSDLSKISLVCCEDALEEAFEFLKRFPHISIERICYLPFLPFETLKNDFLGIPVEPIDTKYTNLTIYLKNCKDSPNFVSVSMVYILQDNPNSVFYYLLPDESASSYCLKFPPLQDFYINNKQNLDSACALLSDKKSKEVFMQRVRAYETGDFGYLHFNGEPVYFPKSLQGVLKKGDCIIDAGISGDIFELEKYSSLIGKNGKIYAFEASPIEYEKANVNVSKSFAKDNTELLCLGLWNKASTLNISIGNSGSSLYYSSGNGSIEAKLVALDDFVRENNIQNVDYIKMDIEGAELNALIGAEKTIRKYRPNMAICIYHLPTHMWEIINYIDSLNLGYKYYLHHHGISLYDTVLYVVRPDNTNIVSPNKISADFIEKIQLFIKKCVDSYLLKTKRVLIYGAGCNFEQLYKRGRFRGVNVVGVTDKKFEKTQKFKEFTAVPVSEITDLQFDIVCVTLTYASIAVNSVRDVLGTDANNVKFIYL